MIKIQICYAAAVAAALQLQLKQNNNKNYSNNNMHKHSKKQRQPCQIGAASQRAQTQPGLASASAFRTLSPPSVPYNWPDFDVHYIHVAHPLFTGLLRNIV